MKVGDLVKHVLGKNEVTQKMYSDWGHSLDFQAGIIISTKNGFARVLPCTQGPKPAWYQLEELEVISESR